MAFDAYMKIDGIPGESRDDKYPDWIGLTGFNFGTQQAVSDTASSVGRVLSGRVRMSNFTITKFVDKATCKLLEISCTGKQLKEVTITLNRADMEKFKYFEIVLENVYICDYSQSVTSGTPVEIIQLNYAKIKTVYNVQPENNGRGGGKVAGSWDRFANTPYA
jgi:type VI secretion system secreted protein Hcp